MRAHAGLTALITSVGLAALLAGCGGAPTVGSAPPSTSADASTSAATPTPGTSPSRSRAQAAGAIQRCHTGQLSARLGQPSGQDGGQRVVPLVYTNTSKQPCDLHGVPGLDLHGPADPNGPVYTLPRKDLGGSRQLAPGSSASARVVVLTDSPGSSGSLGSTGWVPTQLVTIPPGETTPLTVKWPAGLTVTRQDSATHPGSWVESFTAN